MTSSTISRFVTGDYVSPPSGRSPGQRIVAVAYLIRHPDAIVLFDTGFPFDEPANPSEGDEELWTYPRSLADLLQARGASLEDLDMVVNCHLHIDHAGGNFRLPSSIPISVQDLELAEARRETDALVQDALALDRLSYRSISGETEILPGIVAVPTPGHTHGHQSLIVDTVEGPVVLAGQAMPGATDFATAVYASGLEEESSEPVPPFPAWLPRILAAAPVRVMFAHDLAIWEPD
jgi:N-acyl homoserine lactone hydrolase